jgi:hypothetical protein
MRCNISLYVVISLLFLSCDSSKLVESSGIMTDVIYGSWKLSAVAGYRADSIQQRQRLILRRDSTYSCTFSLSSLTTRDTTRMTNPTVGRWNLHRWKGESGIDWHTGIDFYLEGSESGIRSWAFINGGVTSKELHFSGYMSNTYDLSWSLVQ